MTSPILQLDLLPKLPLWAQVLLASRLARRAALWLPAGVPQSMQEALLARCDSIDRCARAGGGDGDELRKLAGERIPAPPAAAEAAEALHLAADAAFAAEASLDFSAAETACTRSVLGAVESAGRSAGLNPLQVRIFAASDLDLLRFACDEARIGRYDGLGQAVTLRLPPVYPPDHAAGEQQ